MRTPRSQTYITGEQEKGYGEIDKFFDSIAQEINLPINHPDIEIRVTGMYRLENKAPTDAHTHMFLHQERVIATVIETRTLSNYVQFDFFQNLERVIKNP